MIFKKTTTLTCNYKVNELPENWQNDFEAEELEKAIEESIEERVTFLKEQGYREGEFLAHINTDVFGLETPEDGWYVEGWINLEEENKNE